MSLDRLRYEIRVMGKRVILTPILVMIGVALFAELLHYQHVDPARFLSSSLEMILPVAAGVIVATIASHDPAIELQLTVPSIYHITAVLRLFLIFTLMVCIALLSSSVIALFKLGYMPEPIPSWSAPLQFLTGQLTWLAPLLWFVAVGLCLALLLRSRSASAALLGSIWLVETLFKDYIAATNWLRPVFLFPTTLLPLVGPLPQTIFDMWLVNRIELIGIALILLTLGWILLHNSEGLLKGSSEE